MVFKQLGKYLPALLILNCNNEVINYLGQSIEEFIQRETSHFQGSFWLQHFHKQNEEKVLKLS